MPEQPATVLTPWEPFIDIMTLAGAGMALWPNGVDFEQIDAAAEQTACERAEEGVERARDAGLSPQLRIRVRGATIAETILSEADDINARAIVLGTRGLTGSHGRGPIIHSLVAGQRHRQLGAGRECLRRTGDAAKERSDELSDTYEAVDPALMLIASRTGG